MSDKEPHSLDILGIKPVGEAINKTVGAAVDGAQAFLGRICLPAAEEFGLLLRDRVSHWRANHAARIAEKAEKMVEERHDSDALRAHPRLVTSVIEQGSWADKDEVQDMWAGLLASSCTKGGTDDSNLIFVNLLSQMTTLEATIINRLCKEVRKELSPGGTIRAEATLFSLDNFMEAFGITELYHLHRELDHLSALRLMWVQMPEVLDPKRWETAPMKQPMIYGCPTPLALNLYVRCKGFIGSPIEYFGLTETV
jgi:hypothetical protein